MRLGERDRSLDGLRGLAAVSVLLFHVWRYVEAHAVERPGWFQEFVLDELRLGLYLFFALSGFVLFRPYVRAAVGGAPAPRIGRFVRRRIARIAPAYWVCIAVTFLLLWNAGGGARYVMPAAHDLWLFALLAQNFSSSALMTLNPPTWTLSVEIAFYLLLPAIGALVLMLARRARGLGLVAAPLALIVAGLTWNALTTGESSVIRMALPAMLPYFACGMLAAVAVERWQPRRLAVAALSAGGAALVATNVVLHNQLDAAAFNEVARELPAAAGFGLLLVVVGVRPSLPVLGSRPMVALGTVSYGLYLWHVPVILWTRTNGLLPETTAEAAPIVVALSLLLAVASWFAVERPAIDWARRTRPARTPRTRPVHVPAAAGSRPAHKPQRLQPEFARGS